MNDWINALNAFSESWLNAVWRACWQGAVALIAVWVTVKIFPQLSPSISCWLWRLAFLKLLVSFLWATPVELPLLPARVESNTSWSPVLADGAERLRSIFSAPAQPDVLAFPAQEVNEVDTKLSAPSPSFASVLFLFWLLGLAFHFVLLVKGWRTVRCIQSSCEPVNEREILSECAELCRQFGLRFVPHIGKSEQVSSPMLLGFSRPTIVLPSDLLRDFSFSQIRLVLAHELAHLKRKDLLWNWLSATAQVLFFFHPLVWLAKKECQLAQEMACDELAILQAKLQPKSYAEVLLRVAENCRLKGQKGLVVVGMGESFTALKRRLVAMQFVKPITPTKAIVWFVALTSLALFGIVPWRLVAQTGEQTKQETIQRIHTAVKVPLKRGLELTYEGSVQVTVRGKETRGSIKVNEFVKEIASDGSAKVVSLRVFRHPVYGPDASLRFVSVKSDGKEIPPDEKQLAGEVPSKLLSLHFVKVLLVHFVPTQNLKLGFSWVTKEHLPVYLYAATVSGQFLPWVEVEMKNRVVKQEQVGSVRCWLIHRTLTKPVPIYGGDWAGQLSERNETLWVDAKTGIIHRVEAETILEGQKGKFRHNALKLQLKSQRVLTGSALERRLKELKWVEMMQRSLSELIVDLQVYRLWETLDKDKIDLAQIRVKSLLERIRLFNRLFPNSPYAAYWAVHKGPLTGLDHELEQTEEIAERVGELAPDFELTSVEGEKIRLSDLKGKVVLLNFVGMVLRDEQVVSRRGWIWLLGHLEQIHHKFKDKGLVVLGVWTIHPPERQKEFVEALKLPFTVLIDENSKVFRAYKVTSIPTDIVIGKDGRIRFIMGGYMDKSPLVRAIEEALKE